MVLNDGLLPVSRTLGSGVTVEPAAGQSVDDREAVRVKGALQAGAELGSEVARKGQRHPPRPAVLLKAAYVGG